MMTDTHPPSLATADNDVLMRAELGELGLNDPAVAALAHRRPEIGRYLQTLAQVVTDDDPPPVNTGEGWLRFSSHVAEERAMSRRASRFSSRVPLWSHARRLGTLAGIGALVIVVIGIRRIDRIHTPQARDERYATAPGKTSTIQLRDGSSVVLGPASRIEVPASFGHSERTVIVHGDARFTVTHASGRPFIVEAGDARIRVLGTTFDVRHNSAHATWVGVTSGRVAVITPYESFAVSAGYSADVTDSSARVVVLDTTLASEWLQGRLVFDEVPAASMLAVVGRWYGYEFRCADSAIARRRITAVFRVARTRETLTAIEELLDAQMTFSGSAVVLTPRHSDVAPRRRGSSAGHFSPQPKVGK
jgi:ferric-dicitrate binding protein FerR (iron transport regulator)